MRVLHVIWNLGQGGAQKYLLDLLRQHRDQLSSAVLVLSHPGPLSCDVEDLCDRVDYLNMRGGSDIGRFFRLVRYLRRSDPTLIHSHSNNTLFNLALHLQSKPVVYTEHGGRLLEQARPARILYSWLSRPIKKYIAISNYMRTEMIAENPGKREFISVIYNGVDLDQIGKNDGNEECRRVEFGVPDGKVVGFVGRLVKQKGVDYFIETAFNVLNQGVDVSFVIVGDGPMLPELKAAVEQNGFDDRIFFLGYQKDAVAILGCFDLMLFTSRSEGFGLVLTEAMATGVPVVAMDHAGAVSEIVRDGIDGRVVDGANTEMAAKYVMELLDDPDLRAELGQAARARVAEKFSMKLNAQQVAKEYHLLADSAEHGAAP